MNYTIPLLPLSVELESRSVLKKLARAHRALAELKGVAETVPNQNIIIGTLALQEAAGFRKLPGTELKNEQTGKVVYTPPQDDEQVEKLMHNLEQFINNEQLSEDDPLTKMAIIHHQFESIHPFYDGNGRTGRIINVLYLVKCGLLDTPVLYLSRYINKNKSDYYRLLQTVRKHQVWEEWILYVLEGIIQTSTQTINLIRGIKTQVV